MDNKCSCHKSAETIEIAEYSSGRITANGIEVVSATDTAERECPICGRTSNLVALDKDCPFCYPNRDDISMVGIDVKPVKDLDWSTDTAEKNYKQLDMHITATGNNGRIGPTTDTAEKECTCYAMLIDRDKHPHFWECPQFKWPKWPKWQFDKATPNTEDCATYPDCKGHLVNGETLKFSHCEQCKADTSDWRERFREQFVAPPPFEETLYSIKPEFIEVFIEKLLEEQRMRYENRK